MFSIFLECPSDTWRNLWLLPLVLRTHMYIHTCAPNWTALVHFSDVSHLPGIFLPFMGPTMFMKCPFKVQVQCTAWSTLFSACAEQCPSQWSIVSDTQLGAQPHCVCLPYHTLRWRGSFFSSSQRYLPSSQSLLSYSVLPLPQPKAEMVSSQLIISRLHNFSFTWLPECSFLPQNSSSFAEKTKKQNHLSYPSRLQSEPWPLGTALEVLGDPTLGCFLGFFVLSVLSAKRNPLPFSSGSKSSRVLPGCKVLSYFKAFSIMP